MSSLMENCSLEEICEVRGSNLKTLIELRDRLREWLELQPHLPKEVSNEKLEYFIMQNDMSLEQAKQKLDMHYTIRTIVPELFTERDPLGKNLMILRKALRVACFPKLSPERWRIVAIKAVKGYESFNPWDYFKYFFLLGDIRMEECRSLGDTYIYDFGALRMSDFLKVTPTMIKKSEITATKAYGAKIKGLHFINAPTFIDKIVTLMKSVIKPKLAARIYVHNDLESLYKFIPKELLPSDYGGDQPSIEEINKRCSDKVDESRGWLIKQESAVVNESLRPGEPTNIDNLFGFPGTFRKLEVD